MNVYCMCVKLSSPLFKGLGLTFIDIYDLALHVLKTWTTYLLNSLED